MNKLTVFIGLIYVLAASVAVQAGDKAIADRYNKSCVVCHASGAAGAPKTGVPQEWSARMGKGMDVLVQSVDKGLNAMPPKGMCFDCSTEDFKALILFMAAEKK